MCGRFTLTTPGEILAEAFGLEDVPSLAPRYNIAPTQPVAVVRRLPGDTKRLVLLRWGLAPGEPHEGQRRGPLINARAETAATRGAFREAFRLRRCLIPADGFYEWSGPPGPGRHAFLIRMKTLETFAMGGLWEPAVGEGEAAGACTILTTAPNGTVRPIHDRMPLILKPGDREAWLDPGLSRPEALRGLLVPYPGDDLTAVAVGPAVNNPKNDGPLLIEPA